jgi:hypothetical protein
MMPGTGKIRGQVTRNDEPLVGVTVELARQLRISDERGAFSFDASPGARELLVTGEHGPYSPNVTVSPRPDQDAQVSISIDCACCRAP